METYDVDNVILVASGKGGVGKTTVAADLAIGLKEAGLTTGFIDADVSTPNSIQVLGDEDTDVSDQRLSTGEALVPPVVNGVQVVSQGLVVPDDVPVLRGAEWRAEVVVDYIEGVEWEDGTDAIVIDSPPGSGSELQTIAALDGVSEAFIVTTPHPSSQRDARKTHEFFEEADIPHQTIINMSRIAGPEVARHVMDSIDFSQLQGVGQATHESVQELALEQTPDYPLFGSENGVDLVYDNERAAEVPYTAKRAERIDHLADVIRTIAEVEEVEA